MKRIKIVLLIFCCFHLPIIAEAHPGIGIVMDNDGNVFYTDLTHVWKITPDGNHSIAVRNVHTHELYLDSNGDLYGEHEWYEGEATDKWGNYVWCLSKDGVFEKVIPDVEGFLDNTTLNRDLEGNSYWAKKVGEGEVLIKQTPNGQNIEFSNHQFTDVRWMHYSENDKNLYVVDHLTVKRVNASGFVTVVSNELKEDKSLFNRVSDRHYVYGLWTDSDGNVFVALYGAGKVKKISPGGDDTTVYNSKWGWSPCGGLIDKNGNFWIMEFSRFNKTRVRKVIPNGEDIVYGG